LAARSVAKTGALFGTTYIADYGLARKYEQMVRDGADNNPGILPIGYMTAMIW